MSNQYIEAICTMPKEIAFGYDAYSNLSLFQKGKVEAGIVRPTATVGYRWHYAKEAAYKLNNVQIGQPMSGLVSKAFNKVNGAYTQYALPPTSNKSAWYQGAIALQALAIYTGEDALRKKARDLYRSGDNASLKTDIASIQSAAKNVYRKCARAMEKAGLSSEQSQVRSVTSHLKNYAKISEIVFGKNLSIESSSDLTLTKTSARLADNQKRAAAKEEAEKVKKARGLNVNASAKLPFKSKSEGNVFRNWVNDNHRKWAKKEDLSRSGSHTNKYMKKAWKRWAKDYQEAMLQQAFMERAQDNLADIPKPVAVAAPLPIPQEVQQVSLDLPAPFSEDMADPFADDPEVGMIQLLEDNPGEFLKQYWYVPAGGFVGLVALALGIKAIIK